MKHLHGFFLASLAGFLAGCNSTPAPPALTLATDSRFSIRADFPAGIGQEMSAWYPALPSSLLQGGTSFDVLFMAKDGQVYSTSSSLTFRQGEVLTAPDGTRFVQFRDGQPRMSYPTDPLSHRPAALSTTYPKCTAAPDGPYWRSWSNPGYGAVYSILNIANAVFPAKIGTREWAAYQYMGGQARDGATEVDAGLVYYGSKLRSFYNVNGTYVDAETVAPSNTVAAGASYPVRLNVNGQDTLIMRIDRPGGQSSILLNISGATGFNAAGTNVYWKRMVTIANGDLQQVFPTGYDASRKYNAVNGSTYTDSKLGTFSGGTLTYAPWSASSISSFGCAVTSGVVTTTSGSSQTDNVIVKIDMNK